MCENKATLILIDGSGPDEYTLSCAEHEEVMKSDTHIGSFPFAGDAPCCYIATPTDGAAPPRRSGDGDATGGERE